MTEFKEKNGSGGGTRTPDTRIMISRVSLESLAENVNDTPDEARPAETLPAAVNPNEGAGTVYFFGVRGRRIKIGHTINLGMRLRSLRWQFGLPCVGFLARVSGGRDVERAYHERFSEHRHGKSEWFDPAPEILAEIDRLNAQVPA